MNANLEKIINSFSTYGPEIYNSLSQSIHNVSETLFGRTKIRLKLCTMLGVGDEYLEVSQINYGY